MSKGGGAVGVDCMQVARALVQTDVEQQLLRARGLSSVRGTDTRWTWMRRSHPRRAAAQWARNGRPKHVCFHVFWGEKGNLWSPRVHTVQSFSIPVGSFPIHPWIRTRQLCTDGKGGSSVFCTKKEGYSPSPKNPALQQLRKCCKSASAGP